MRTFRYQYLLRLALSLAVVALAVPTVLRSGMVAIGSTPAPVHRTATLTEWVASFHLDVKEFFVWRTDVHLLPGMVQPQGSYLLIASFPAGVADVASEPGQPREIPTKLFLDQNYPNPFNPSTVIRFGLPSDTHVKLTVHSILGTKMRTLIDQDFKAGTHTYDFVAGDLPSGTYFYRLQTDLGTITRRMTIFK